MKPSTRARHWLALAFGIAWVVVTITQFADFSGEPAPRWRAILNLALPGVTLATIALNIALDRRRAAAV